MSFETVVRPFVIRTLRPPAPSQLLVPEDDPSQGFAVLSGAGMEKINSTYNEQSSWSKSRNVETQRTVDRVRIYQKEEDGTVNKENFVDVEEAKEIRMVDGKGVETRYQYASPVDPEDVSDNDNILILEQNIEKINKDYYEQNPKVDDDREPNVG